ncbi:unnamed protein product [Ixodes hexagonus]
MPPKKQPQDQSADGNSRESDVELGPSTAEVLALMQQMSATLALVTERLAASTGGTGGQQQREPELHPWLTIPVYTGFDDRKSVADFLGELDVYARASGSSERHVLERILPMGLQASTRRWWTQQPAFSSLAAFHAAFREEFLPAGYAARIQRELERRTQHPEEGLVEYIRAMQELYNRAAKAAPESERVTRIIRQCHPRFHAYLHGRTFTNVEDLVRAARGIQDMLLASDEYKPPPPAEDALEPSCAWVSPTQQRSVHVRAPPTRRPPEMDGAFASDENPDAYASGGVSDSLNS